MGLQPLDMHILVFFLIFISFKTAASESLICGLYQSEDFGNNMVMYTLTDFRSGGKNVQVHYTIQNPATPGVRSMLRGLCYCVEGDVRPDPDYVGDKSYKLILVKKLRYGPYNHCSPY